ncbi:hypothetical protein CANARDRAFT_26122 [[Candida] arabinofermentans NRRL YB-2248]|uniref:Uncharacterized protein n=1 Tax=[Candida] arabinofermentans NRRL YB-2248 TaxID=983967 RepID=A0A1E4T861_9ASCO|nr:hypothetical protein CANARDRAFT_26122 [[Candida] arabinofermentans NRRL YB-2248]
MFNDISNKVDNMPTNRKKGMKFHANQKTFGKQKPSNGQGRTNNNSGSKQNHQIQAAPNYKFNKLFTRSDQSMFPFLTLLNRPTESLDGIDYIPSGTYHRSNILKFSKPLSNNYTSEPQFAVPMQKTNGKVSPIDPIGKILNKKDVDSELRYDGKTIQVGADGTTEVTTISRPIKVDILETPSGSKRTIDHLESTPYQLPNSHPNASILSSSSSTSNFSTPSPKNIMNRLTSIKKRKYDRLDNSMTISAKGILRMVDDSLVSSDTELYSHSLISVHPLSQQHSNNTSNLQSKPMVASVQSNTRSSKTNTTPLQNASNSKTKLEEPIAKRTSVWSTNLQDKENVSINADDLTKVLNANDDDDDVLDVGFFNTPFAVVGGGGGNKGFAKNELKYTAFSNSLKKH